MYLLKNKIFIFFNLIFLLFATNAISKNTESTYSGKNVSNYFSGIISINKNNTSRAFDFLKKVKLLQDKHYNYNAKFSKTLILLGKFEESFDFLKKLDYENAQFYEADLILGINYFVEEDYLKAEAYFNSLKEYSNDYFDIQTYISEFLTVISKMAQNNKEESLKKLRNIPSQLNNLKLIQEAFTHCYFDSPITASLFSSLIKNEENSFERYNFFLLNYFLHKNNYDQAKKVINKAKNDHEFNSLIRQSHEFLSNKEYNKVRNFFNCKNSQDVLAEFFYIIANLYSSEENYILSNFYLNISNYLNEKFSTNQALLAENYFYQDQEEKAKKVYFSIKKIGNIYSWYASKRLAYIYSSQDENQKASKYLKKEFNKISKPDYYNYLDLANFLKSNKDYKEAIKYYTFALENLKPNHKLIPTILDKRGACYERSGEWENAEKDLKKSLELSPDQPYVLNYLAYSWLEKNINLEESLKMLKKADQLKQNDGYIIDSLGWGFYLTKNYPEAEKLLRRAVELMPTDPVIIDHYGDVLWMLNKNIQARYVWMQAKKFELTDEKFKAKIDKKLIFGLLENS